MARKCAYCGMSLKGKPQACPLCGSPLDVKSAELHIRSTDHTKKKSPWLRILPCVAVVLVLAVAIFLWNRPPEPPPEISQTPEERWNDHLYLENRSTGLCKKLTGKVALTFVFVNEPYNEWDPQDAESTRSFLESETQALSRDAASYGVSLEIHTAFETWDLPYTSNHNYPYYWQLLYAEEQGFPSLVGYLKGQRAKNGADSAPLMFLFCKEGRSYSIVGQGDREWETAVLFNPDDFRHELFHLYGADDYYFHPDVEKLAKQYLTGSIMNDGKVTDDLTAYCIGWMDTLSETAITFLEETMVLNYAELLEARTKDQEKGEFIGTDTVVYTDGGTYTGEFLDGVPHGQGTYTFPNGSVYTGQFENGYFQGYGHFTSVEGGYRYEGDFCYNRIEGAGTLTLDNGDVYVGEFLRGYFHGQGTYTYANGKVQDGFWEYGEWQYGETSGNVPHK